MIIFAILFVILFFWGLATNATITWIITGLLVIFVLIYGSYEKQKEQEKQEQNEKLRCERLEKAEKTYNEIKSTISIPSNALKIKYTKGYADLLHGTNYVWTEDNNLCFFPEESLATNIKGLKLLKIPLNKIEYYATKGEVFHENKISGGGGGGSSIGGAVAGGVIAGGAGAVIGSRKKSDPIKSELVTHDSRETFLNYFDEEGKKHSMFFSFEGHNILLELIPEKAFEIVNTIKTNQIIDKVVNEKETQKVTDQIRELAKLKEEGIISEEEFAEKKRVLLAKI